MKNWQKLSCYIGLVILVLTEFFFWGIYRGYVVSNSLTYMSIEYHYTDKSLEYAIDVLSTIMWINLLTVVVLALVIIHTKRNEKV